MSRTTQMAKTYYRFPMRRHIKSRFPSLHRPRLCEKVATDTLFSIAVMSLGPLVLRFSMGLCPI